MLLNLQTIIFLPSSSMPWFNVYVIVIGTGCGCNRQRRRGAAAATDASASPSNTTLLDLLQFAIVEAS